MKNTTNFKPHIADAALLFGAVDEPSACEAFLVMEEIWKDVKGYEGFYQVSNLGRVKSFKSGSEKILSTTLNPHGYPYVTISKKKYLTHRLVALAFLLNPENKPTVNHISGIRSDNRLINLEWATQKEQIVHAFNTGLAKKRYGKDNFFSKPVYQYDLEWNLICKHDCAADVQRKYGIHKFHIYACCNGKRKSTGGYRWLRYNIYEN